VSNRFTQFDDLADDDLSDDDLSDDELGAPARPDRPASRKKLPRERTESSTPTTEAVEGTVLEGNRGQYLVETPSGRLLCELRGNLRKQLLYAHSSHLPGAALHHKVRRANVRARDPVVVGGRVRVTPMGAGRGLIVEVLTERGGAFSRADPDKGTARGVAGIDQLVAVFAARDPEPHLRLLDRVLVVAEAQELASIVCLNKVDLGPAPELLERLDYYRALGYPVVLTSASTGRGIAELRQRLGGRTSALLGPSGVGKSSLLNAVEPELGLRVSSVSQSTHKGRHTTTGARVVPLAGPDGGHVADMAGIRALGLGGIAAGKLDWCFRELRPFLGSCFHADCGHRQEPGCAVSAAVESGQIDRPRYESYCRLHEQGEASAGRVWRDLVSSRSNVGEGEFRL
jgi:ribosome biogenesis GTPase / thiamine phosphate phosphatase